jgi:hypothetical protein
MHTFALWLTSLGLVALLLPYKSIFACSTDAWCYSPNALWLPLCLIVTLMSFWIYKKESASNKRQR